METCKQCNYQVNQHDAIETVNGFYLCQACDSKRLEKAESKIINYYYIDFNDCDIYSNEGETEYNDIDHANKLIGNSFSTFIEAKHALQAILDKNK